MRVRAFVCAFALAFAGAAAIENAFARGTTIRLDPADPNAVQACISRGGTITVDAAGNRYCNLPAACLAATGPTVATLLDPNDPNAVRACTDACGTVSTNAYGQYVCVAPANASSPGREPTNID